MEAALSLFRSNVICFIPYFPLPFFSYVWMAQLDFIRVQFKQAP